MDDSNEQINEIDDDCLQDEALDILSAPTRSLVAIGVAVALNCHVCLRRLIPTALNNGVLSEEVSAAVAIATEIRTQATAMTDSLGATLVNRSEYYANGKAPDDPRS